MYSETNKGPDQMKEFINKVAEKLGLPSEKIEAAVKSVRKEWMEKMITDRIQEAVQKGTITQAEAGQILEWLRNPWTLKALLNGCTLCRCPPAP